MEERAEMEIDVGELFRHLQKRLFSLIAAAVVCGILKGGHSHEEWNGRKCLKKVCGNFSRR